MPIRHRTLFFALLMVVGSMLSLTIGASIAKGLFPLLGPAGATLVRLSIATIVLFMVWRPWCVRITRQQMGVITIFGVVLGAMNLTFYEAIARLPLGIAIALEFLGPLSLAFFLSKGKLDLLWASLALIGVVLLLPLTRVQARIDVIGVLFALAAGALWACYILVGKKAGEVSHAGPVTAIGMFVASLTVAPFGFAAVWHVTWSQSLIVAAVAMGVLSSAIPYSLEMAALKHLDSKTFGILLSLEPAFGAMAAFIVLHERITVMQGFAIAGVIAASIGSTITSRKQATEVAVK